MTEIFSNMPQPGIQYPQAQKAQTTDKPVTVKDAMSEPEKPVGAQQADSIEISSKQKEQKEKKGPIKTIKGFIANVKKFTATTSEYVKGTIKGLATGAVAGSVVYTAGQIINSVKTKSALKAGKEATKIPNKLLAGAVAVIALGANIWTASLNATEKQSQIDHRWTGHNNK